MLLHIDFLKNNHYNYVYMVINTKTKVMMFVLSLVVAGLIVLLGTFFSTRFNIHADEPLTKTITIIKNWQDNNDNDNRRPNTITAYIKKKGATLMSGSDLNIKMKTLAGSTPSVNEYDYNVTAIKYASPQEYDAVKNQLGPINEIQTSGEEAYAWFDDATGTMYFYAESGEIYAGEDFSFAFAKFGALTRIDGLAAINTTHVTNMNRLFQDSYSITDLTPITNWYTGNVTDMTFMFGGNTTGTSECINTMQIASLAPLADWNVSKVTSMYQMFKCNRGGYTDLDEIAGWDVSNVINMAQMFNQADIEDASAIADWNVVRVRGNTSTTSDGNNGFFKLFYGAPVDATMAGSLNFFTKRSGEWILESNTSYYLPSNDPISEPYHPSSIPNTGEMQICSDTASNTWVKDNANNVWSCTITVANDGASYVAWEDRIPYYNEVNSSYANKPIEITGNQVTFTNIHNPLPHYIVTLKNTVSGDASSETQQFDFTVMVYDENGDEISSYYRSVSLKSGESEVLFSLPEGYSYLISENGLDYTTSYVVNKTSDGTLIMNGNGTSLGPIAPAEDQTVIFTNNKTFDLYRTITITKEWIGDDSIKNFVRPSNITAHIKKTVSNMPTGASIKNTMINLAGSAGNITAIKQATSCNTSGTQIQTSGERTYMWYSGGTIYLCSEADNVYANDDMSYAFNALINLKTIDGLAIFNTTYTTKMNHMFQNSRSLESLAGLENWDTGNVTTMRSMFASSDTSVHMAYSDLRPLANWNTQSVIDMNQMFKTSGYVTDLSPLSKWNVESVTDMSQMFNRTGIKAGVFPDASKLASWHPIRVLNNGFDMMFANTNNIATNCSVLPQFTERSGNWCGSKKGTYVPSSGPSTTPSSIIPKTPDATNEQTCTGATTTGEDNKWSQDNTANIWTCNITLSNDGSIYKVWEDTVTPYTGSSTNQNDAITISGGAATIKNTLLKSTVKVKKEVVGNMADLNRSFGMTIKIYSTNDPSAIVSGYIPDADQPSLSDGDEPFEFILPRGWAYKIVEEDTNYDESFVVETNTGTIFTNGYGCDTGIIVPNENDHIVTFTNRYEALPLTGIFGRSQPFRLMIAIVAGTGVIVIGLYRIKRNKCKIRDG